MKAVLIEKKDDETPETVSGSGLAEMLVNVSLAGFHLFMAYVK